jgi:hypothetical protein
MVTGFHKDVVNAIENLIKEEEKNNGYYIDHKTEKNCCDLIKLNPSGHPHKNNSEKEDWTIKDFNPDICAKRRGEDKVDIFEVWYKQPKEKCIAEFIWVNRVEKLGKYCILLVNKPRPDFWESIKDFIFPNFIIPKNLKESKIEFIKINMPSDDIKKDLKEKLKCFKGDGY